MFKIPLEVQQLIEARKQKQVEMARSKGRSAPNDFVESDLVVIQDMMTKKWDISGTIKQARVAEYGSARSFIIEHDDGAELLRNSKYIKHQWKNPRVKKHIKHVSWVADGAESAENIEVADIGNGGPAV